MKIRPVGAELSHADRHNEADSSLSQMMVTIVGGFVGVRTECSSSKSHKLAVIRPVALCI
jgi:hypothetical protein